VIIEMDERATEKNYTFLTHAARCLALWRGKFADEVALDAQNKNEIATTNNINR